MLVKHNTFVGIDVSMATLDISVSGKHFKIKNEREAIAFFIQREIVLKDIKPKLVCLESTGGYEIITLQGFHNASIPIHRAHPNKVHAFAQASGHFAKTDKLDARLLERYASFVSDEEKGDEPIPEHIYELQELRSLERDILDDLHANKCRVKNSHGKTIDHLKAQIDFLENQLKTVRKDIDKIVSSNTELSRKREILVSHCGVAKLTANALIADLPELGKIGNKKIASLVGVVPKTYESGTKKLGGNIRGGRFHVRKAMYMAALVASRHDKKMKAFYDRLLQAGKAKKAALVAVMRKIIVCLNAMVRNNTFYQEDYMVTAK